MNHKIKSLKIVVLIFGAIFLMANRGGSPGGRTGSTTDGGTCTTIGGCHGPKIPVPQEMISTTIPSSGYIPGETYTFSVLAKKTGVQVWGFEMMSENANGNGIGAFIANSNVTVTGFRATHKFASSDSNDAILWKVDWVAPVSGTGNIDIYCAVLATNNSGTNGGDNVFIDTLSVIENTLVKVSKIEKLKLKAYPNPTTNFITLSGTVSSLARIEIYSTKMELIESMPFKNTIDVQHYASGVYILKVVDQGTIFTQRFLKQ